MPVRAVKKADLDLIQAFHKNHSSHELEFTNSMFHGVYENENGIIAYGAVKEFKECVISVDLSKNLRDKDEAIKELFAASIYLAGLNGETTLYAFAQDSFAALLKKHFGFVEIPEKLLAIKVKNGA
jgi:hypothetical protein